MAESGAQHKETPKHAPRPLQKRGVQKQLVSARHGAAANESVEDQAEGRGALQRRAAVSPVSGDVVLRAAGQAPASPETHFGHDFSRVPARTAGGQAESKVQAKLAAPAYPRGQTMYVGAGEAKQLPQAGRRAGQQAGGLVKPTLQTKAAAVGDEQRLEQKAVQRKRAGGAKRGSAQAGVVSLQRTKASSSRGRVSRSVSAVVSRQAATYARMYGRPSLVGGGVVQRRTSNGVSVSRMRFAPSELPADGKATSQATARYGGRIAGGAKIKWSIIGTDYGSTVDDKGRIKAGPAIKKGKDKVRIKVKAEDSVHAGAHTFGRLTLWDTEYLQAKKDYPKFRALHLKMDPYTPGRFGKLAIAYRPPRRRLEATLRVGFTFKDDKAGAATWNNASKRHFRRTFVRLVQNMWSNQYRFVNERDPQSIWKKLNPVRVRVRVQLDDKNPHQAITVHKKNVGGAVGVGGVTGKARLGAHHLRAQPAFNPATGAAELADLAGVTPTPIKFDPGKSKVKATYRPKLEFMAEYLRRIKNPRFKITITGHHKKVVHAVGATRAQKRAASQQARRVARDRANAVHQVLKEGRATNHRIRSRGVGETGAAAAAAWDKAQIASALPTGWQNIQKTLEHEAGHMLGLGDEYVGGGAAAAAGKKATHYILTMKAFGQKYADLQAKRRPDSAGLMHSGNDLRPHHYVTLWDGLVQLTSGAALPATPFTHKDWKFQGEE